MKRFKSEPVVSVTIKDISRRVVTRLRRMAALENRSLNREVIHILERAAQGDSSFQDQARRQVEAWRALASRWVAGEGSSAEVRAIMTRKSRSRRVKL